MDKQTQSLNVLLVEDQSSIARNIADYMEAKGHVFDFATQGQQAVDLALENYFDLISNDHFSIPVYKNPIVIAYFYSSTAEFRPVAK